MSTLKLVAMAATVMLIGGPSAAVASFKTLYGFCAHINCRDGESPGGLVADTKGNLYGLTSVGGASNNGTLFELSRDPVSGKWKHHVLHDFCKEKIACRDEGFPTGPLIIDKDGNLYGIASGGDPEQAGVAFEFIPASDGSRGHLKILHKFCSRTTKKTDCADGYDPFRSGLAYQGQTSGVPYDGVSPLFGTAESSGAYWGGVAFELQREPTSGHWRYSVIYAFCAKPKGDCADGKEPWQRLVVDRSGNLFGVTGASGGVGNPGKVYELSPGTRHRWRETVLHSFCPHGDCSDGAHPNALAMDRRGDLFGTTYLGGAHDWGVIYKLTPNGENTAYQILYNFCSQENCEDGGAPRAGLTIDQYGNLFGTTYYGGRFRSERDDEGTGVVFRFGRFGDYYRLHSFCGPDDCKDGKFPSSELLLDANGDLFGTTSDGGKHANPGYTQPGTVFELVR